MIRLEPGDRVVGAVELTTTEAELVFITNDAQLLHFPAGTVRPQGRSGGGMAGIKLGIGARVIYFGAVSPRLTRWSPPCLARPALCPEPMPAPSRSQVSSTIRPRAGQPVEYAAIGSSRARILCCSPGRGRRLPSPLRPAAVPFRCRPLTPGGTGQEPPAVSPSRRSDRPPRWLDDQTSHWRPIAHGAAHPITAGARSGLPMPSTTCWPTTRSSLSVSICTVSTG